MPVLFEIVGESYVDYFCFLSTAFPQAGGDSTLTEPLQRFVGGSPINTATHLQNINNNKNRVSVQTILNPDDDNGRLLISHSQRRGFDLINLYNDEHGRFQVFQDHTPHCVVVVSDGDRRFMTHRGCAKSFGTSSVDIQRLLNEPSSLHFHIAGLFCTPGFSVGMKEFLERLRSERQHLTVTSLVTQFDVTETWDSGLQDIAPFLDILIMNETEANRIMKDDQGDVARWLEFFCQWSDSTFFVVTLGAKGAIVFQNKRIVGRCSAAHGVNVVDPTGAGDAFAAGMLHGLWESNRPPDWSDENLLSALEWGCAVGTASVTVKGASEPVEATVVRELLRRIKQA